MCNYFIFEQSLDRFVKPISYTIVEKAKQAEVIQPFKLNKQLVEANLLDPEADEKDYNNLAKFLSVKIKGEILISVNILKKLIVEFNANSYFKSFGTETR